SGYSVVFPDCFPNFFNISCLKLLCVKNVAMYVFDSRRSEFSHQNGFIVKTAVISQISQGLPISGTIDIRNMFGSIEAIVLVKTNDVRFIEGRMPSGIPCRYKCDQPG